MTVFDFFRWRESEVVKSTGEVILRPIVDVTLISGDLEMTTPAIIDTGAPRTLFPRGVGDYLGVEFGLRGDASRHHKILGSTWAATTAMVTMCLDSVPGLRWEAEADFLHDEGIEYGLLGLEGFLNKWAVTFVASNNYFIVESVDSFERRIPTDPFQDFQNKWPDPMG